MSSTPISRGCSSRLRLGAWLRGAAIFTGTALVVTVALVLLLNHYAFPAHGVTGARLALLAALAAVAGFGIAFPLMRLTRARAVREAEAAHPELEQRLTTFHERERNGGDPFLELLAADTLSRTQDAAPSSLVPDNRLFALGGAGLACLGVLVWMIAAGPGYLGYGASLLWTGPKKNVAPLYAITVTPGDVAVRRNSDQLITAQVTGMQPEKVQILCSLSECRRALGAGRRCRRSRTRAALAAYQFVFAGLPENVEYYVAAGPLVSPHYKVRVVDLPSVKEIRVTYHYPKWTGMKPVTEEHSGDLRAIEGTDAAARSRDGPSVEGWATDARWWQDDPAGERRRATNTGARSTWRRTAPIMWPRLTRASRCGSRRTTSSRPTRRCRRRLRSAGPVATTAPVRSKR